MGSISVIIVSWNARDYLAKCLSSLSATGGSLIQEIIVVDNASTDGSPAMVAQCFPDARLVCAGENLGFARANNLGATFASGRYLALVNSDVVVHPDCLQRLTELLESDPSVGLAGPRVFGRDQKLQITRSQFPTVWNTACHFLGLDRIFPGRRFFAGFDGRPEDHEHRADAEVLSGCFWLIRRRAFDLIGGLDERFFFYAEDVDWCKRCKDAGWKAVYLPEATATHFGGGSSANAPVRYSIQMLRANLAYWEKHHGRSGRLAYLVLAFMQHSLRLLARCARRLVGRDADEAGRRQLAKHWACVRWIITGKES